MEKQAKSEATPSDRANAVQAAMALFRVKGYANTSMADIVAATGMNRYAIYTTFGSKRDLFIATLGAYFQACETMIAPIMADETAPPLEILRRILDAKVDQLREDAGGCLIFQVALEESRDDPKIAEAVTSFSNLAKDMAVVLMRAIAERGELNPNLTPEDAVQLVFDAELSVSMHARAGADRQTLERIGNVAMAALCAPGAEPKADRKSAAAP